MGKKNTTDLKKALLSGNVDLSEQKLKQIIEKELQKDEGDINTKLIDCCFELLETAPAAESRKSRRVKFKTGRKISAAAAALLLVSALSAAVYYFGAGEKVIDDSPAPTAAGRASSYFSLTDELSACGISDIALPGEMLGENCTVTDVKAVGSNGAAVEFEYGGASCEMLLESCGEDITPDTAAAAQGALSQQTIDVNSTAVFVFEYESSCTVIYKFKTTLYHINMECNVETASAFAKTLNIAEQ